MTPGDMPDFEPSLQLAADSFRTLPAVTLKHMIVISDGDPTPPRPGGAVASLQQQKVQVSTVAVGTHGPAGSAPLRNLAQATGGQYYAVRSPSELPRIFQREARRVAKPLIVERRLQTATTILARDPASHHGTPPDRRVRHDDRQREPVGRGADHHAVPGRSTPRVAVSGLDGGVGPGRCLDDATPANAGPATGLTGPITIGSSGNWFDGVSARCLTATKSLPRPRWKTITSTSSSTSWRKRTLASWPT